jgi:DNA-directed RNA polymerase alpha subunit
MILNKLQAAWIPRDIENLETKGLSGAAIAALKSVNIQTVGNLLDWKITELFSIQNFGVVMMTEVFAALRACSFQVPENWKEPTKRQIVHRNDTPKHYVSCDVSHSQDRLARNRR